MSLSHLPPRAQALIKPADYAGFELARIIAEHKERYEIQTTSGVYSAIITGNLRFSAESRADFPAVGDWVKVAMMDEDTAIIYGILPRFSLLARQAVGQFGEKQLIATNIDYAFLVQAPGHDFNLNRLERYLVLCAEGGIEPIILLNKIDTTSTDELAVLLAQLRQRLPQTTVLALSAQTGKGLEALRQLLRPNHTHCFLGSSGVGKSTIVNALMGQEVAATHQVSDSTQKGQHTTTHRALFQLPNGSLVIDTPGMRELGMIDSKSGAGHIFAAIEALITQCKFTNCTHENEQGCAVRAALDTEELAEDAWENFQKLQREQAHFSQSLKEKRDKDRNQGKLYKRIQTERRKRKG